jgi:hypothetical protein
MSPIFLQLASAPGENVLFCQLGVAEKSSFAPEVVKHLQARAKRTCRYNETDKNRAFVSAKRNLG